MLNLHGFFDDQFESDSFSISELSDTAGLWVGTMTTNNPGGVFTARANALQVALSTLETNTTDKGVKLGLQKIATGNKRNFREALVGNMAKVHAKVVAQYGKDGPEVAGIFPHGLAPFAKSAKEEKVENELGVVLSGISGHAGDLPAGLGTEVGGYLSAWILLYAASQGSKLAKTNTGLTGTQLRKALTREMTKTVLFVALTFLEDQDKCDFYLPTNKLFNPESHEGPGAATLSAGTWNATTHLVTLTMQSDGATVFTLQERAVGATDWNQVLDDIGADAEGNGTFDYELPSGSRELRVIPRNGDGVEGDPSNVVTVHAV